MFGYVRPFKGELKVREWETYRAAYCALCAALGRRHGLLAQMFLNYDFTFLVLLLLPAAQRPQLSTCRCPAWLWCGKKPCLEAHPALDLAADESVILTWWKLRDGVNDGPFWKSAGCRVLCLLLRRSYRRSSAACPEFDAITQTCLTELSELEGTNCPSLDRPADAFARILRAAAPATGDTARDRATGELLYHVGRWIYLLDAWDDRDEDRKSGAYNPMLARFSGRPEENEETVRLTLRHSRNLAASACALLDLGCWQNIVENILYLGLPQVEELVFQGCWSKKKRGRRDRIRRMDT